MLNKSLQLLPAERSHRAASGLARAAGALGRRHSHPNLIMMIVKGVGRFKMAAAANEIVRIYMRSGRHH